MEYICPLTTPAERRGGIGYFNQIVSVYDFFHDDSAVGEKGSDCT